MEDEDDQFLLNLPNLGNDELEDGELDKLDLVSLVDDEPRDCQHNQINSRPRFSLGKEKYHFNYNSFEFYCLEQAFSEIRVPGLCSCRAIGTTIKSCGGIITNTANQDSGAQILSIQV